MMLDYTSGKNGYYLEGELDFNDSPNALGSDPEAFQERAASKPSEARADSTNTKTNIFALATLSAIVSNSFSPPSVLKVLSRFCRLSPPIDPLRLS